MFLFRLIHFFFENFIKQVNYASHHIHTHTYALFFVMYYGALKKEYYLYHIEFTIF